MLALFWSPLKSSYLGEDKNIPLHLVTSTISNSHCLLRRAPSRCCLLNFFVLTLHRSEVWGFRQCAPKQRKGLWAGGTCVQWKCSLPLQHSSLWLCFHSSLLTHFLQGKMFSFPQLYCRLAIKSGLLKTGLTLASVSPSNISKNRAWSALNQSFIPQNKEDCPSLVKSHRWQMFSFIPFGHWQWQIQSCDEALRLRTSS